MTASQISRFRPLCARLPDISCSGGIATDFCRSFHLNQSTAFRSEITADIISLFSALFENPNCPKILHSVDSILAQSHIFDSTTSVLALRCLAQSRKLTRAKTLLTSLKQRTKIPNIFLYSIVLQCLLPLNPISDVEYVWNELSGEPFGSFMETFVLHTCQRCDDAMDVDLLCRRLLSNHWPLSHNAFSALIGALCLKKNPNPTLSRDVLREMVERAMEVDYLSYYTVFRSFCRIGDPFGADSVLRNMAEQNNYGLDQLIYGDFLHCLCKSGRFREARKLFDKMLKMDKKQCSTFDVNRKPKRRVIFQLRSSNFISETLAFEAYFRSLCSCGRLEEAKSILKEAVKKHIKTEVCVDNAFIKALFCNNQHDEAILVFETKRKRRDASTVDIATVIIASLCNSERVDESHELAFELMNEGYVLTVWVWNLIIKSYLDNGREEKAMNVFEGIRSGTFCSYLRPDQSTYEIVIHGLLRLGMVEKATRILEDMERRKLSASFDLYSALVRCLHSCGMSKEVQGYLNSMIENGVFLSFSQWEVMFKSLT